MLSFMSFLMFCTNIIFEIVLKKHSVERKFKTFPGDGGMWGKVENIAKLILALAGAWLSLAKVETV